MPDVIPIPDANYVYHGSSDAEDLHSKLKFTASDSPEDVKENYLTFYATEVDGAGDLDDDGFYDLVVASRDTAYVYYGGSGGIDVDSEQRLQPRDPEPRAYFMPPVGAGDVDADGIVDLLVGGFFGCCPGKSGDAYLYYGGEAGLHAASQVKLTPSDAEGDDWYGHYLDGAGDLDGDGHADLVIGAPSKQDADETWRGAAYVYTTACASYRDADSDGYGDPEERIGDCDPPEGYAGNGRDCDDSRADVYPGTWEVCDGVDQDCSGVVDEEPIDSLWYVDADGDGFGDPATEVADCADQMGMIHVGADCDDGDPSVHPGAAEVLGDGVDQDCDGVDWDESPRRCACATGDPRPVTAVLALLLLVSAVRRGRAPGVGGSDPTDPLP